MKSIDQTDFAGYNEGVVESGLLGIGEMAAMTVERRNLIAAMVVLGAGVPIQLYGGILAGLHEDWMRMSLFLFGSVLSVFAGTMTFVGMRLKERLTRVEDRFQVGQEPVPVIVRRIGAGVSIFAVLSIAGHMTLSVIAGFRGNWFRMGIHLTACAITVIVCTGVLAMMSINTRLARLEQLPAGTPKAENA
jgi:hypothetical protein